MKTVSCILLILIFCACVKKQKNTDEYYLSVDNIEDYKNEYDDKGRLVKVTDYRIRGYYDVRDTVSGDAKFYYYDERDSLKSIRGYSIYPDKDAKQISLETFFTDSSETTVRYRKYPTDTAGISKRMWGIKHPPVNKDTAKAGTATYTTKASPTSKKEYTSKDTIITDTYDEQEILKYRTKKYHTKEYFVETSYRFEDHAMDSIYYKDSKEVKAIYVTPDEINLIVTEYDHYNNITKRVRSIFRTREAEKKVQENRDQFIKSIENYKYSNSIKRLKSEK